MIKFHEINGFNSGTSRAAVTDNYVMMVAIAHAQEKPYENNAYQMLRPNIKSTEPFILKQG